MKKLYLLLVIITVSFFCMGCQKQKNPSDQITGTWITCDGKEKISFNEQGKFVINDSFLGDYAVYDDNNIIINVDTDTLDDYYDINFSGTIIIEDDILYLLDSDNKSYWYYSEEYAEKLINDNQGILWRGTPPLEALPYPVAYPSEWLLHLDDTQFEGYLTTEDIKLNWPKAEEKFKSDVLNYYQNSIVSIEQTNYSCDCVALIWDDFYYLINLTINNTELDLEEFSTSYAIPVFSTNDKILTPALNHSSTTIYDIWNGRLGNVTYLLNEI